MNYQEALDYLAQQTKFGINLGLERIQELLRRLGNPQDGLKVVHIGGTNGKGSTAAMIASVLRAAGYRTGLFTSPHLHSYTERYRINGQAIAEEEVARLITGLRPVLEQMVADGMEAPTEFEVSTALAFLWFARQQVDWLVLEVGLGGEIDSTNVVRPEVVVITNVGMDHMDYLGPTIADIARAKAGIIKPGCPVVTGASGTALEIIQTRARELSAPLWSLGQEIQVRDIDLSATGTACRVQTPRGEYFIQVPLLGAHQAANAALAVAALLHLRERGAEWREEHLRSGLAETRWPGRLEIISQQPLVILDGAHNLAGAQALAEALPLVTAGRRLNLVLGMLADKEREKVLALLAPCIQHLIITRPNSYRAGDWQALAAVARQYLPDKRVELYEQVEKAIERGLAITDAQQALLITGSLYMIADARSYLLKKLSKGGAGVESI